MTRVTSKGQVTIPKEIREKLGIKKGDEIEFERREEGYIIKKKSTDNPFERWRGKAETDKTVEERIKELRDRR